MSDQLPQQKAKPRFLADYSFIDNYQIPLMKNPPVLDGELRKAEWREAFCFDGFSHQGALEQRTARAFIGATARHLYFAICSEMPKTGKLIADATTHTSKIVWDDSVEIWINPLPGSDSGATFQCLINSLGFDAYQVETRGQVSPKEYYGWKGNYRIVNNFVDGFWHCLVEVPINTIVAGRQTTDGAWAINVCRNFKNPWAFSSLGNQSYNPNNDIIFKFDKNFPVAVECQNFSDPFTRAVNMQVSLLNVSESEQQCEVTIALKRDLMPDVVKNVTLNLAASAIESVVLKDTDLVSNRFMLFVMVRQKTGETIFSRLYSWGPPREHRWDSETVIEKPPLDFCFAYYPYKNLLRLKIDTSNLPGNIEVNSIGVFVREKATQKNILSLTFLISDFVNGACERDVTLFDLNGVYEIVATVDGGQSSIGPVIKQFERNVYEWEHKNLGKSRFVYPPFTPIKLDGKTMFSALKQYDLGSTGLLDSVRTMDQQEIGWKDILSGPMTLSGVVGGRAGVLKSVEQNILEVSDDIIKVETSCAMGEQKFLIESTLEYDGMFKIDLTIETGNNEPIEKLDLCIPVRDDIAKLMHTMSDGIRHPIFTAAVPDGLGVLWNAAQQMGIEWPINFCTYIFVGDARRGICWFAENDRGWSWDPVKPNIELVRDGDSVSMCIHLVSKPFIPNAPQTLTFGVQAAPVKPRIGGWRHRWYTDRYSILGCDRHWCALGICSSVYPAGKDLFLWEELKRSNTEHFTEEEIERFVERGKKYYQPYGQDQVQEFETFARKNLRNRFGTTRIFYYDRGSNGSDEEFHTFIDEWCKGVYNNRNNRTINEVKIVPSESYIDYALYWYGKSFDIAGNTGVYIDNNFFNASYNCEMTGAYKKEDGTIMPSTGIWGLRELAKRTFVYLNERGMEPINMVHMTSAQILPVNSFYTVQYDWEYYFSEGDVHNRFSREYLQTISSGEHLGAWPIVLHEQGKSVDDFWTLKTFLGVSIIHELLIDPYIWHGEPIPTGDTGENRLFATFRQPIMDLCQKPDVIVYRYWDDRKQPVVASSVDFPTIVFSRNGSEAIVAVTSYAFSDEQITLAIDPHLLGFSSGYKVVDIETDESISVKDNTISFSLKKHDLREFKILVK